MVLTVVVVVGVGTLIYFFQRDTLSFIPFCTTALYVFIRGIIAFSLFNVPSKGLLAFSKYFMS